MKHQWLKRTLSGLLAALVMTAVTPAYAQGTGSGGEKTGGAGISPLAEFFDESQMNPVYLEWLENGGQGVMPAAQDFSYLAESYARLALMQNYALPPEKYDLRDEGRVEPVLNQDVLGICWALAANSAAASPLMEQFPQIAFSPIHTTWFTFRGPEEEEYRFTDDPYNAGGGDGVAVGAMAAWKGPVFAEKAPLNPSSQQDPDESLRYAADYHLQDAYYMPHGHYYELEWEPSADAEIIKQVLMETGAVTIHYYASGENTYNEETCAWYNSELVQPDHAVLIVGWDDTYPKENFCEGSQPENDGAWLVRNSWGTDWGDDGYFWLSYEDKTIQSGPAYLLEEADNYAKNYQYDTMGWSYSMATNEEQKTRATAANIFTAEGDEQLEAVSFYTTDAGAKYEISIYTGVNEGDPESGTPCLTGQAGIEPYAGYHTIELNAPVELKAGERFSIVITLENPIFENPLAIEWCPMPTEDYVPAYMGSGGESYVFSDGQWFDMAGGIDGMFYITNACIKGFTNPLPESGEAVSTVRFSEMEGPVADGTEIELTAEGADELYYSEDGENYSLYNGGPLKMDFSDSRESYTIWAYAKKDSKQGNTVQKTYTKASAQLTDLALSFEGGTEHFETNGLTEETVYLPIGADSVQVMAQSSDVISVNGAVLKSSDWSTDIPLEEGQTTDITIRVEGEGKTAGTYTLHVYRSMLTFDYQRETIRYDESKFSVKDAQGNLIHSGGSITGLISTEEEAELTVVRNSGGSLTEYIPKRRTVTPVNIDYTMEQTLEAFSDVYAYSINPDMSDAAQCEYGQAIPLTPGVDMYIQRQATDMDFASTVYHLEVPGRPKAPKVEAAEVTETSVTLRAIEGAVYSNGGDWQAAPVFTGLTPGKTYLFQAYLPADEKTFGSETGKAEIATATPEVIPADYSFEVKYVDGEGSPVPGGGVIAFEKAGPYSREDIPLPYGYMEMIPAHPDESWLYPTALEFSDGAWRVTNPVVEIMVEPMASVNIIFKDLDGNILADLGYTEYYDSEGGGMITVAAPEGYELIGEKTYAVEVARDETGKLTADPSDVVVIVKAVGAGNPSEPSEPTGPSEPSEPEKPAQSGGDGINPETGDESNAGVWVLLLLLSGSSLLFAAAKRIKN